MERKCVRGKNDDKELNMQLATWMVENPFNETAKDCGGETRKMWLIRMFRENNILKKTNDAMSAKVQFLRKKYLTAKQWSESTGQAVLSNEGPSKFIEVLLKMCPWFYIMHGEFPSSMSEISSSYHNQMSAGSVQQEDDDFLSENSTGSIKFSFVREDQVEEEEGESNRNLESPCSSPAMNVAVPKICFQELNGSFNMKKRRRDEESVEQESEREKMSLKEKEIACQLKRDELKYEYKRYKLAFKEKNERERRLHEKEMARIDIDKLQLQIQLKKMEIDKTMSPEN